MRQLVSRFRYPSAAKNKRRKTITKRNRLAVQVLERREMLAAHTLDITIENLSDPAGLAQTPFWVAAHDGTFDIASLGQPAANFGGLEAIAEEGDVSGLVARFASEGVGNDTVITAPDGFPGAPVFEAGETVTQRLTIDDSTASPYFSFASMVIPSNDAFVANLDPLAFRVFDSFGDFLGTRSIVIYGAQVYDAGTEVNDPDGGAAFASAGGTSVDESGVITSHPGLDDFVGAGLPTGETLGKAFGGNTPIARITIAPAGSGDLPIDESGPKTELIVESLTQRADFHEITVIYSDPSGVDPNSLRPENLRITGPLLTQLDVLSVTNDAAAASVPNELTATYRVAPASGSFTALDNGTYSVVLLGNEVSDPLGLTSQAQLLGEFDVDAPVRLNVSFENLSELGGLATTPVWIGSHNGNFIVAQSGSAASDYPGLELLAEEGDVSELVARFAAESGGTDEVIFAPDGFPGAPVFEPGETVTTTLDIADPLTNRFFSYASMVIPSNDAFIANLNPRGIELFDRAGDFTGARSFTIYGNSVWDAGTEVNDPAGGAAFSTLGGTSIDEGGVIRRHDGLDDFIGTALPTGENLELAFESMTPIGRFTISLSDVPSTPIDLTGPQATLDATTASMPNQPFHEVRVTYSDSSGVDVTSIDVNDIRVDSTLGASLDVIGVTTDAVDGQVNRTVTATYQVAPTNGQPFSTFDNGLYFVNLIDEQVGDTLGNEAEMLSLGSFEVLVPIQLEITVENLSDDGGLAQTPFWVAVHEGNFVVAAAGGQAANYPGLEALAEEGDVSGVVNRFALESGGSDSVVLAPDGFAGAPVFEPGEIASTTLDVFDTNANRFFSFASMIIPSNDAFVANLNPRAYELFDEQGFFRGEQTITLVGGDVWDAGTEVNGVGVGAAFSSLGGTGVDEDRIIRRHDGLDEFIGTPLPTGSDLAAAFASSTPIARITIGLAGSTSGPIDNSGPAAALDAGDVVDAGVDSHTVEVTYSDASGVDLTTIDADDLQITGPLGHALTVTGATIEPGTGNGPQSVTVTYTVTTSDNQFTARNNGRYRISVVAGEVADTLGQDTGRQDIGFFTVDVGVRLQIEVASLTEATGLSQTPFWVGFHNGGFEVARGGVPASQFGGLELIAEEGDPSELVARFASESTGTDTVITAPDGFAGAPVFEPGEIASQIIEIERTDLNRYFSFTSMVIPSNDAFVANRDARRYELFDSRGNFHGARQITLYGRDILDAGTEVNDPFGGAAFSTEGGMSTGEAGLIRTHAGLDAFIGTGLPTGETLGIAFGELTPIATITISLVDPEADGCSNVLAACSARSVSLQNAQLSADVNRDGNVTPIDALLVVNFIGRFGNLSTISDEAQATGLALDVQGDELISPVDALAVINEIERLLSNASGGEGEQIGNVDSAFAQLSGAGSFLDSSLEDEGDLLFDIPGTLF